MVLQSGIVELEARAKFILERRNVGAERREDHLASGRQGAIKRPEVGHAVLGPDEEVKHGPVVPQVPGPRRIEFAHVRPDPLHL